MSDKLNTANDIILLLGFNPANRSDEFLKMKGLESLPCDDCGGVVTRMAYRCAQCNGTGELFRFSKG